MAASSSVTQVSLLTETGSEKDQITKKKKVPTETKTPARKDGDEETKASFSNPVYKALSRINGEINKLTRPQLVEKLESLNLDTRGDKSILKKRLKLFYKKKKLTKAKIEQQQSGQPRFRHLLVLDFEATCEEGIVEEYPHEIIEFPIVLFDTHEKKVIAEFQEYVRPVLKPKLTTFCKELTGITQEQVDKASTFPEVLQHVTDWMVEKGLTDKRHFALVTDGPWDMSRFMFKQCQLSGLQIPTWARRWINVRKIFSTFYGSRTCRLSVMLETLGMTFEGRPHSGLHDSRNITRIAARMLEDGADLRINERMHFSKIEATQTVKTTGGISYFPDILVDKVSKTEGGDTGSESDFEEDKNGEILLKTRGSENYDQVQEINSKLKSASIESDGESIDDLLTYYALQKS